MSLCYLMSTFLLVFQARLHLRTTNNCTTGTAHALTHWRMMIIGRRRRRLLSFLTWSTHQPVSLDGRTDGRSAPFLERLSLAVREEMLMSIQEERERKMALGWWIARIIYSATAWLEFIELTPLDSMDLSGAKGEPSFIDSFLSFNEKKKLIFVFS